MYTGWEVHFRRAMTYVVHGIENRKQNLWQLVFNVHNLANCSIHQTEQVKYPMNNGSMKMVTLCSHKPQVSRFMPASFPSSLVWAESLGMRLQLCNFVTRYDLGSVERAGNKTFDNLFSQLASCPDPTQLTRGEGVWCHKSKSLWPAEVLKLCYC